MDVMSFFNISATLNLFRLITKPNLLLPQATIPTFNQLPIPLNKAFESRYKGVDIRAVVLDKDNCFAVPHENGVFKEYKSHFDSLKKTYSSKNILIVSNTAGSTSDPHLTISSSVTTSTGLPVLTHADKKPGCSKDIMDYFLSHPETGVTRPDQVVVVGDRLTTDVMLANMMGGYAIWIKDGVLGREKLGVFAKIEQRFANFLLRRGHEAPHPCNQVEK